MKILTFVAYNESLKNAIIGGGLLLSLLSNTTTFGQSKKHKTEQLAKLSTISDEALQDLIIDINSKGYQIYGKKTELTGDNYLFSSGINLNLRTALNISNMDADNKIKFLGKKGNQLTFVNNSHNLYTVIIITEIKNEKEPSPLYNRDEDEDF